jgi:hypothetical protein
LIGPPAAMAGRRFFLASYLPTACATLFVLVLVWAGARGWREPARRRLDFSVAWNTGAHLGATEILALSLSIALLSFLLSPLQTRLVQIIGSSHPRWARRWQRKRRDELERRARIDTPEPGAQPDPAKVAAAGVAGHELRRRFSLAAGADSLRVSALGNALAAGADRAGRPYGLDTAVAWQRLYPLLGDQVRAVVDDRRDSMDAAARTAVVMAGTALVGLVLLLHAGPWLLLALVPTALAALAYGAAVQAALAYGDAVCVAFDLHHLDLLNALRIETPHNAVTRYKTLAALSDLWRQGVPLQQPVKYRKDV